MKFLVATGRQLTVVINMCFSSSNEILLGLANACNMQEF